MSFLLKRACLLLRYNVEFHIKCFIVGQMVRVCARLPLTERSEKVSICYFFGEKQLTSGSVDVILLV
jgi:hypothetical protein